MLVKKRFSVLIRGKIDPKCIIHSDGWRGYDGLVDVDYDKHFREYHGQDEFANSSSHINGIESFWSFANDGLLSLMESVKGSFMSI